MLAVMEKELTQNLRQLHATFMRVTGAAASSVWLYAARDAKFMDRIDAGGSFSVRTYDKIVLWFSDNWPPRLHWPKRIVRPPQRRGIIAPREDSRAHKRRVKSGESRNKPAPGCSP